MTIKKKFFKIPKILFFAKDLPMLLVKKCHFFSLFVVCPKEYKKMCSIKVDRNPDFPL